MANLILAQGGRSVNLKNNVNLIEDLEDAHSSPVDRIDCTLSLDPFEKLQIDRLALAPQSFGFRSREVLPFHFHLVEVSMASLKGYIGFNPTHEYLQCYQMMVTIPPFTFFELAFNSILHDIMIPGSPSSRQHRSLGTNIFDESWSHQI
jgi:hypothetical protein